ncbi:Dual specificity phosphatase, catalytic domain [Dillenia turbinata]|uniref:Dual specificity phosphatase, catalytic domain n=1 Tax=Dillenia turbinata TaxID=194707 RepID=A0AAN8Z945_9MAGN
MGAITASSGFSSIFASGFHNEIVSSRKSLRNNLTAFKKSSNVFCKLHDSPKVEPNFKVSRSKKKVEDYNSVMKRLMRNPYEYHHDLGMNYTLITENLIVGSQPQKPDDIDHLKYGEDVAYILNLQQDKDIEYWGIDFNSILRRCTELGICHMRSPGRKAQSAFNPVLAKLSWFYSGQTETLHRSRYKDMLEKLAKDFDPDSLRSGLPKAVSSLEWALSEGNAKVYVHCTAGLGRAPAVAIAYMFWFCDMDLNMAYNMLTSNRPCGPNRRAIRGATYDLAKNDPWKEPFESLPENAFQGVADWERKLIQDRVHSLRES